MAEKRYEILIDKKENPKKCTIQVHRKREDFSMRFFSGNRPILPFTADCLLHVDGEDLSRMDRTGLRSLALIDCTWRKVEPTLKRVPHPLPKLVRIPEGFVTAYPRKNKKGEDPASGLATIEALFIAAAFLGFWDETLLDQYHWKIQFLEINSPLWQEFKLGPHA